MIINNIKEMLYINILNIGTLFYTNIHNPWSLLFIYLLIKIYTWKSSIVIYILHTYITNMRSISSWSSALSAWASKFRWSWPIIYSSTVEWTIISILWHLWTHESRNISSYHFWLWYSHTTSIHNISFSSILYFLFDVLKYYLYNILIFIIVE